MTSSKVTIEHCAGCAADRFGPGHRIDCPCAYSDHHVPESVIADVYAAAEAEYIAWGAETLAMASQSGLRLLRDELRDAVHAAARQSEQDGHELMRLLDEKGAVRVRPYVEHGFRVRLDRRRGGYRVELADTDLRMSESMFRVRVPATLDGFEVLEVTRFDGGSFERGVYSQAAALTRSGDTYSNHVLIFQDEVDRFVLHAGHYDFATRTDAADDARQRVLA
ncbi:hypothetical protein [Lentzea sp. NBRC 102530]|uniref:hypothetical protein n=1 Tax=Lentzea sp. NBRC 102530 TaxID=3032201 RepID=UPI0024A362F9|nr:hypothetical protein [Lentzea sp. NBRC 102530]GLY54875.1 hypothetical protein Lesp01_85300 [Lentzea sp. NBRC 102530]